MRNVIFISIFVLLASCGKDKETPTSTTSDCGAGVEVQAGSESDMEAPVEAGAESDMEVPVEAGAEG